MAPTASRNRSAARRLPTMLTALLLAGLFVVGLGMRAPTVQASVVPASGPIFLNLSATSLPDFVPNSLTVSPGSQVVLRITQQANFDHTFTLSSVANVSLPTSDSAAQVYAYFQAHVPFVNLSLGSVPGAVFFYNFTAPSAGSYEFLCEIPGHFQGGMHGELVSAAPGSGGSAGSAGLSLTEEVGIAVVVVVVAALAVVLLMRRKPKAAAPPPTSGS